jgi:hypothetical protein
MADLDIPELKRDQLGKGVRGKYLKHFYAGQQCRGVAARNFEGVSDF